MSEQEQAKQIADNWLDFRMNPLTQMVPGDPDCDAVVLARQYVRLSEAYEALKPRPLAWDNLSNRSYEPVEIRAKEIYEAFVYDGPSGTIKPKWTPGGNGMKQDQARDLARRELRAAGHTPKGIATLRDERHRNTESVVCDVIWKPVWGFRYWKAAARDDHDRHRQG